MMSELKGIGIHFFANTRLKPKHVFENGESIELFPLYVTVVYGQKNTQFRADFITNEAILVSEDLKELEDPKLKTLTKAYSQYITDVIEKEVERKGDQFKITGLGKRLKKYSLKLADILVEMDLTFVFNTFDLYFNRELKNMDDVYLFMAPLLELNNKRSNITLYEWYFENGKKKFEKMLHGLQIQGDRCSDVVEFYHSIIEWWLKE